MAAAIEKAHPGASVELIDGGRGDFVVKRSGQLLWDKRNVEGRFPEPEEILKKL